MRDLISIYRIVESGKVNGIVHTMPELRVEMNGVLDLIAGGSGKLAMKNVQESTHILMCRYIEGVELGDLVICNCDVSKVFEVVYVDNPMNRFKNLEIELKFMPDTKLDLAEEGE